MTQPLGFSPESFLITARADGDEIYVVLVCRTCADHGPASGRLRVWPAGPPHVGVNGAVLASHQRAHWSATHAGCDATRNGSGGVVVCDA